MNKPINENKILYLIEEKSGISSDSNKTPQIVNSDRTEITVTINTNHNLFCIKITFLGEISYKLGSI